MKTSDAQLVEAPVNGSSVLLIDSTGVIVDAHDTTCAALGWLRDDLLSRRMNELLEFGAEQLMERLPELQDAAPDSNFSVLTLVRRQDQRCVPTTAIVRLLPELGCYSVSFDDLPGDEAEANPQPTQAHQPVPAPAATAAKPAPVPTQTASAQIAPPPPNNPRFRNIFLNDEQRPVPKPPAPRPIPKPDAAVPSAPPVSAAPIATAPISETSVQAPDLAQPSAPSMPVADAQSVELENAKQEQRRLEERVLSLTEQLQQLHAQLKSNLESEALAQKRLREREADALKAEQAKTAAEEQKAAAETALAEQQKQLQNLEADLAKLKSDHAQQEADRAAKQQEWLVKLQTNLIALHESDQRLASELENRRALQQSLQSLHQDFAK